MHPLARSTWFRFIAEDEGNVAFMYLDTKLLVTVGIGNLIDPISRTSGLPFRFKANNRRKMPAGSVATRADIEAEWKSVKHHPDRVNIARRGHTLLAGQTDLELSESTRQQLFAQTTESFEATLKRYFPDFDRWPADAQLALMAMGWGLGPGFAFKFPKFAAACKSKNFSDAATESRISTWHNHRNARTHTLFWNASIVEAHPSQYPRGHVYFPGKLSAPPRTP